MEIHEELRSRFFPYIKIHQTSPILSKFEKNHDAKLNDNHYGDYHHNFHCDNYYVPQVFKERKQSPRSHPVIHHAFRPERKPQSPRNHQYFGSQKEEYSNNKSPLNDDLINFDMALLNISNNNNNGSRYSSLKSPCKSYTPEVVPPAPVPEIPAYTIPEIVIPTFQLEMIGGANLVLSASDFDEKHLRLDCLVKMQVEVLNNSEGKNFFEPEKISLGEGNLRIFLNKNYVTLITFSDNNQGERSPKPFQFISPLFCDLAKTSYAANSEMKSISWHGISTQLTDKTEGVSSDSKKQLNRYTAIFPKTRIFIHATNVFIECNHAAERSGISMENFLQMTNRDVSLMSAPGITTFD